MGDIDGLRDSAKRNRFNNGFMKILICPEGLTESGIKTFLFSAADDDSGLLVEQQPGDLESDASAAAGDNKNFILKFLVEWAHRTSSDLQIGSDGLPSFRSYAIGGEMGF